MQWCYIKLIQRQMIHQIECRKMGNTSFLTQALRVRISFKASCKDHSFLRSRSSCILNSQCFYASLIHDFLLEVKNLETYTSKHLINSFKVFRHIEYLFSIVEYKRHDIFC